MRSLRRLSRLLLPTYSLTAVLPTCSGRLGHQKTTKSGRVSPPLRVEGQSTACCTGCRERSGISVATTATAAPAAWHPTRLLFDRKRRHGRTPIAEAVTNVERVTNLRNSPLGTTTLELNLLEDPTAGLASGPAEELTPTELETRVRVLVSSYSPSLYRLIYTPFIDVMRVMVRANLVPRGEDGRRTSTTTTTAQASVTLRNVAGTEASAGASTLLPSSPYAGNHNTSVVEGVPQAIVSTSARPLKPEEVMARWFTDGAATLKHPHETAEAMGKRRWSHFCRAMEAHWSEMEEVMPLTRVVRQHGLREELYVPLFRQLAMELVDPAKRTAAVQMLPGIILSLANGRAPKSLGLPEKDHERVRLVSNLFLGVAQESGNTDLAYLALQLLRANNMETPFSSQKQLTNVFSAAARLETDWQMRASGLLTECYAKWMQYLYEVQVDNRTALELLEEKDQRLVEEAVEAAAAAKKHKESPKASAPALATSNGKESGAKAVSANPKDSFVASTTADAGTAEATEQYRYFTSRREDDITRITALEKNIEAAVRSRAAELKAMRRRQLRRKGNWDAADAAMAKFALKKHGGGTAAAADAAVAADADGEGDSMAKQQDESSRADLAGDDAEEAAEKDARDEEGAGAASSGPDEKSTRTHRPRANLTPATKHSKRRKEKAVREKAAKAEGDDTVLNF